MFELTELELAAVGTGGEELDLAAMLERARSLRASLGGWLQRLEEGDGQDRRTG